MSESKDNYLPQDQRATWPLLKRMPKPEPPAQSGEDLLERLGETVKDKSFTDTGCFDVTTYFTAGDIIAEKYQIIQLLNRGNMGLVYQAKHMLLDKTFAIKVLAPDKPLEESSRQRFQREAHATAALSHPNIISVHDFGVLENGALYLVMEYLEGETLAARLERKQRLDLDSALIIINQICLALVYAHKQGIVHRDLKPSNIMLVKDYKNEDQAIVIDFSIAKFTRKKPNQKTITRPGQIFGSPLYMSPEQCQGKKPDHRSDIYSIGCMIYEILCGTPPLTGDSILATIYKHVNERPAPFSEHVKDHPLPKELQAIVFKTLAKEAENRYQSADELMEALESFHQHNDTDQRVKKEIITPFSLPWMGKFFVSIIAPLLFFTFVCMMLAIGGRH